MLWSIADELWNLGPPRWSTPRFNRMRSGYEPRPYPLLNVYGDDEALLVTSEIPGLGKDDLDIVVHGRTLTIKGSRSLPEIGEDEFYARHQRSHGEFERTLTLPYVVADDKVDARYEGGTLAIHLPRAEADKPKKITVKAG